jgi:hypothetical protein
MSTTPNLGITEIASSQTQKEVTCNTALENLDTAMTDLLSVAITSADVTPTASTVTLARRIKLTGVLTGNRNLIVPTAKKEFVVDNQTTGKFTITVKTASGSGIATYGTGWGHAAGDVRHLYCDGTNVVTAQSSLGGASEATLNLSADTTLPALAGRQNILVDASGGNKAITLPTGTAGMVISVKKTDSSGNSVTVTATIEGATNYVITEQNRVVEVEYDNAWRIRNVYSPSVTADVEAETSVAGYDDTASPPTAEIAVATHVAMLVDAAAGAYALAAPVAGTDDGKRVEIIAKTAQPHVVTIDVASPPVTPINETFTVMTFGGAIGDSIVLRAYDGNWYVVSNINVVLS